MKKLLSLITVLAILVLATERASCQNKARVDSLSKNRLDKDLSIDNLKMLKLSEAMQMNQYSIDTLLKSKTIKPDDKQKLFIKLMQERETKVYALLTPAEQEKFKLLISNRFGDRRKKFQIQNEQKGQVFMLRDTSRKRRPAKQ